MSDHKSTVSNTSYRQKRRVKFSKLPQRFRRPLSASASADTIWKKDNWKEDRWLTGSTNFEEVAELNTQNRNNEGKPCTCSFMGCFCGARRFRKVGAYETSCSSPSGGEEDIKNCNRFDTTVEIELESSSNDSGSLKSDEEVKVKLLILKELHLIFYLMKISNLSCYIILAL